MQDPRTEAGAQLATILTVKETGEWARRGLTPGWPLSDRYDAIRQMSLRQVDPRVRGGDVGATVGMDGMRGRSPSARGRLMREE